MADDATPTRSKADDDQVIQTALKRFQDSVQESRDQRKREKADEEFPFDPWPTEAQQARRGYMYAGEQVPARPMLNIPMLDQPIQLVLNQEKAAHLGIQVHPETEDADDDTAEIDQGIINHIQVRSRASLARSWAFERAVRVGRGYYEIRTRYARPNASGPAAKDQELYICRVLNQAGVYDDPWCLEPDKSDRRFLFKTVDYSWERYRALESTSALASMDKTARAEAVRAINEGAGFTSIGDDTPAWVTDEYVRVAEYWEVVGDLDDRQRKVIWRRINGIEVLDQESWPGIWIPFVFIPGKETYINGKHRYDGMVASAKDSVRLVNYSASAIAEKVAIDTKTPFILAEGQEEGHEAEFTRASVRPVPYVRYKPTTVEGELVPPPTRNLAGPDLSADILLLQQAKEFVHGATATFDPSLGNLSSKDRSGKAILAQQQQADSSNSHYLDNLAEISMPYEAKVLLNLIPKIYDRPGRLQEIINGKDERRKVILNAPFYEQKGQEGETKPIPLNDQPAPPDVKVLHYDLAKGDYGVTVSIGKSYQTRMQQGSDQLGALLQAEPNLLPILGWRYFQYNDNIPGHEDIAEDMKKLRPPALQDPSEQGQQRMQQQFQQMAQQHDLLVKELNAKTKIIETDAIKQQAETERSKIEAATKVQTAQLDRDAKIVIAAIQAKMQDKELLLEAATSAAELLHTQSEAAKDRAHEAALAGAESAGTSAQSAQEAQQTSDQSAQEHQQALEQGEAGHGQAMEQAQQAAELAPEPAENG